MSKFIPTQKKKVVHRPQVVKKLASELMHDAIKQHMSAKDMEQVFRAGAALSIAASEYREHFNFAQDTIARINAGSYIDHRLQKLDDKQRAEVLKVFRKELQSMMKEKELFLLALDAAAAQVDAVENEIQERTTDAVFEMFDSLVSDPVNAPVNLTMALNSIMPGVDKAQIKRYANLLFKSAKTDFVLNREV